MFTCARISIVAISILTIAASLGAEEPENLDWLFPDDLGRQQIDWQGLSAKVGSSKESFDKRVAKLQRDYSGKLQEEVNRLVADIESESNVFRDKDDVEKAALLRKIAASLKFDVLAPISDARVELARFLRTPRTYGDKLWDGKINNSLTVTPTTFRYSIWEPHIFGDVRILNGNTIQVTYPIFPPGHGEKQHDGKTQFFIFSPQKKYMWIVNGEENAFTVGQLLQ